MNQRQALISVILAAIAYAICILAQGFPKWSVGQPFSLFPADTYSIIECVGFVSGVVGVYLMLIQSPINFPVGLIWAFSYAYYFYVVANHLGEGTIMLITAGYLIQGWIKWSKGIDSKELPVTTIGKKDFIILAITVLAGWPIVTFIVTAFQGQYPVIDALTTVLSLGAQYLTNKKVLQTWIVWMIANLVYIPLMFHRGYYPSGILYLIFLVMAFFAYAEWKKSLDQSTKKMASSI